MKLNFNENNIFTNNKAKRVYCNLTTLYFCLHFLDNGNTMK